MTDLRVEIIAETLGRHRSTIFREVKGNMFIDAVVSDLAALAGRLAGPFATRDLRGGASYFF